MVSQNKILTESGSKMKVREKINFERLVEISLEEIPVLSGDNGESKKVK